MRRWIVGGNVVGARRDKQVEKSGKDGVMGEARQSLRGEIGIME